MLLTVGQLQTLKTWLDANASSLNDEEAANAANAIASPDYWCWRTSVAKKEIVDQVSTGGTSFIWAGNGFISRSVGELECWNQLFNSSLTCNPSLANVRQAFADVFSGAGNAASNRAHLLVVSRRKATVAEKLYTIVATGPGNSGAEPRGSIDNPDAFTVEGFITVQNVSEARNQ